jgi:hypothetical protein
MPDRIKALLVALGVLATAGITVLTTFDTVDWSASQTTLVSTEAGATIGLLSAVVANYWPDTAKEPVALAATFTALVAATLALGTGFGWWDWTAEETSALVAVITAVIGVGSALFARQRVTPTSPGG